MEYIVREQPFEEIQRLLEIPLSLCGVNPFGYFRHVRRFVAEGDGAIVGHAWTMASRHSPWGELGHFAVFSREHRRKGLGGRLLALAVEALREAGMEAMFIDTGPSVAHGVYEKHGFRDLLPGHPEWMGLCYDGRSIRTYLEDRYREPGSPSRVSDLDFSHLIEIRALLNSWDLPDIRVKSYLLTLFADDQLHEGQILVEIPSFCASGHAPRRVSMLGVWSGARLVGFSTLAPWRRTRWDNGHESHVGLWDLHLHPACWRRDLCELLLEAVRSRAAEAGFRRLRAMETPEASPKTEILRAMGFRAGFTMPDALVFGEGIPVDGRYPSSRAEDLCAYELDLGRPGPFTHPYRVPWNE